MRELFYSIIIVIGTILFSTYITYGITNKIISDQIKAGEVTAYGKVYTCNYKGKYVRKNVFIPAEIEGE